MAGEGFIRRLLSRPGAKGPVDRLVQLSRWEKQALLIPLDILAVSFSLLASVGMRLGVFWPVRLVSQGWWLFPLLSAVGIVVFWRFGLYRLVLRSFGRHGAFQIAKATIVLAVILAAISYFDGSVLVPRSTPFIFAMFCFLALLAGRGIVRLFYNTLLHLDASKLPVVIYGAGASGIQLLASLDAAKEYAPIAFLDDNEHMIGTVLAGRPVYRPEAVDRLKAERGIRDVLLAMPSITRTRRREILHFLTDRNLRVRTIPSMVELVGGFAGIDALRDVGVDELLGRDAIDPMDNLYGCIRDKVVLVTGAGGSIGSELCRQIVAGGARKLVLYELSEYALFAIDSELRALDTDGRVDLEAVLGSVGDETILARTLLQAKVETVFHAAAYKHVPLVEANPVQGLRNNTFGTLALARAAGAAQVERVVLISTDKAVRPTNVMGASKRLAEKIIFEQQQNWPHTMFCMVRFGNVMGSSGSVIPTFEKQISDGGPVTVTHPDIIRYFMTIPEAAQLVIQAGSMATGGDVFLLDMGEPVQIADLAKRMIQLSGRTVRDDQDPAGDIEIVFTGLRSGEKLYEELLVDGSSLPTAHPKIMRAVDVGSTAARISDMLEDLERAMESDDIGAIRRLLLEWVEGYSPSEAMPSG